MRRPLPVLAAFLALVAPAHGAAPATAWKVATYAAGASLEPVAGQAVVDANGDLFVLATHADAAQGCIVTIKYRGASGVVAWRRDACGPRGSHAVALALDAAGNVVAAGNTAGTFRLLKYSPDGAPAWDQRFSGQGLEVAYGMAVAGNDVFLMGRTIAPSSEIWVARHRGGDGAMAWQQPVDAGAEVAPVALAVDGAGNAFVAGNYANSAGGDDWHLAKLAGSSGAVLWRRIYDASPRNVAAALAVDASGNPVVAGMSGTHGSLAIRTVKMQGATGRTIWEASDSPAMAAAVATLRLDAAGNAIVSGSRNDDIRTLKYAAAAGGALWQATHSGGGVGAETGAAIAIDAHGNVAVTGRAFAPHVSGAEVRTVMYSADGGALWSAAEAGGSAEDSGRAVAAGGAAIYAVARSTGAGGNAGVRVIKYLAGDASLPAPSHNVQGLWWQPAESGWGVNISHQGDTLFATWFTYDENGHGMWLVMSNGARSGENTWEGTLHRTSGPAFNAVPFDPAAVRAAAVGSGRFAFTDAANGVFSYEVNGIAGSRAITRQVFAAPAPACALGGAAGAMPNYQDLWWAPGGGESGWGVNIAHQGDVLFVTWFTYGPDGRGMWLVGSDVRKTGNATYAGTLYRTVGPPFSAQGWNPALVATAAAGHATFVFGDPDNGTFSYTLDGVTQSKPITRQVYASPRTVCR